MSSAYLIPAATLDPKLAPYGEVTVSTVSNETLVSALVVLTHQIDASSKARIAELDRTESLRGQRDLVRVEVLRRMGGVR